jgi:hypothetical protein
MHFGWEIQNERIHQFFGEFRTSISSPPQSEGREGSINRLLQHTYIYTVYIYIKTRQLTLCFLNLLYELEFHYVIAIKNTSKQNEKTMKE